MAKFYFLKAVFAIFLLQVVIAQDFYSIELDGKFTQKDGPYITEILTTGKFSVTEQDRLKRSAQVLPPLTFTGTLTFRTPKQVTVIGVNSSFQLTEINVNDEEVIDDGRLKRETSGSKIRFGLYGQFELGNPNINSEVLGVKLTLDAKKLSQKFTPSASDVAGYDIKPKVEFGFKGIISTSHYGEKSGAFFDISLGLYESQTMDSYYNDIMDTKRVKRESDQSEKSTLNVNGEFIIFDLMATGETYKVIYGVNGEGSFENMVKSKTFSPKEVVYTHNQNERQFYIETSGNVTAKANNESFFVVPFSTKISTTAHDLRKKRNASTIETFEIEYQGNFVTRTRPESDTRPYGLSVKFTFWEISKLRTFTTNE